MKLLCYCGEQLQIAIQLVQSPLLLPVCFISLNRIFNLADNYKWLVETLRVTAIENKAGNTILSNHAINETISVSVLSQFAISKNEFT
jgi:hypothetical protein